MERNASSAHHQLRDVWLSIGGTVVRIEVMAMVAIFLTFYAVTFGSCRRWSSRWIIQKVFLAANALSVSLGTYSIGLMQSSLVKSKMYPVWSVSLLALFASIDSINTFGLDYSGQFLKLLYQLFLYFGYVLVISISGNTNNGMVAAAIGMLCSVTLCKGFHRLMAYVLPTRLRSMNKEIADRMEVVKGGPNFNAAIMQGYQYLVDKTYYPSITLEELWKPDNGMDKLGTDADAYKDICLSFSLCHLLQRRFFGFSCAESDRPETRSFVLEGLLQPVASSSSSSQGTGGSRGNYERAFKVIEVELAFMYDYIYSSNAFVHYYEAGACTAWAIASILTTCFLCVAVALQQKEAINSHVASSAVTMLDSEVISTTMTPDIVITLVILVSLASLQVLQLVNSLSSNWARVSLVCHLFRRNANNLEPSMGLKLRLFLSRIKLLDKYQWQNKLGQYESSSWLKKALGFVSFKIGQCCYKPVFHFMLYCVRCMMRWPTICCPCYVVCSPLCNWVFKLQPSWQLLPGPCWVIYSALYKLFGLQYIQQVLTDMLGISTASSIQLPIEVKSTVIDALVGILMPRPNHDSVVLSSGSTSLAKNGLQDKFIRQYASTSYHGGSASTIIPESKGNQASIILTWHAATGCYDKDYEQRKKMKATTESPLQHRQYRVVATALSKYCMYLVAYVPQLLPGQQSYTTSVYNDFVRSPSYILQSGTQLKDELCEAVVEDELRWKVLADFWVEMLLYLAPSDNVTAHIEQLAQGGEFITHLWALLFHAGILYRPYKEEEEPAAAGTV